MPAAARLYPGTVTEGIVGLGRLYIVAVLVAVKGANVIAAAPRPYV